MFLVSGLVTLALTPLGALGHDYKFIGCFFVYFILAWRLFEKFPNDHGKICFVLSLPIILLYLPIHLLDFESTKISLPGSLAGLIGTLLGFLFWRIKKFRIVVATLSLVFLLVFQFYLYPSWLNFISYGQFSSSMNKQLPTITLVDREGRLLGNEIFKNKIVVLDFWNTSCGACFQKFPLLQELSNNYIKSNVEIYAVNVPLKRDTANQSFQVLEEWNFTFKNLNANESITEAMNVEYFPTTFIVVNGIITFKGDLLHVNSQLEKLLNHKQL